MEKVKSLVLRVTERCNLSCAYCYAAVSGCPKTDMSEELALRAVSLCCPTGGSLRVQFTGGEPLLNLAVMEAVYRFGKTNNRNLRLAVQTNGTLLTTDVCLRLAAMDCAVGVSLDGPGDANSLRCFPNGSKSSAAVVQGIRNLGAAGRRCNLTVVVTRTNAAQLGQLPDLALWLGNVTGIGLDLFRPLGRGVGQNLALKEEDLVQGLRALVRRTKEIQAAGIPFRLREVERLKKRNAAGDCGSIYCYAQTEQSLAVDSAGNCWPCSSLTGVDGCLLGNIRDGLPQMPRAVCALDVPPVCAACADVSLCGGGCPAGRRSCAGGRNPLTCIMHHILTEEIGDVRQ